MIRWLTNDPEVAHRLRAADAAHEAARAAARHLPLAEKIAAYRQAREAREAAYSLERNP